MSERGRPDCFRCAAFFVTHERAHPYGCRTFGMKSRLLPALEVRASSGEECRAFEPKAPPPPRPRGPLSGPG